MTNLTLWSYSAHLHEIEQCIISEQEIQKRQLSTGNILELITTEIYTPQEGWIIAAWRCYIPSLYMMDLELHAWIYPSKLRIHVY